jgi:ABC-type transport system involved in cytochrome bd biosynthesis fused ATPase/permease subunit
VASIVAVTAAAFVVVGRVADAMPGLSGTMLLMVSFFVLPVLALIAWRSANRRIEEQHGKRSSSDRAV